MGEFAQRRGSTRKSLCLLGGGLLVLAGSGCRLGSVSPAPARAPEKPALASAPASSTTKAAGSAEAPRKDPAASPARPGSVLKYVESHPPPRLPQRFDPTGRLMAVMESRPVPDSKGAGTPSDKKAVLTESVCAIWEIASGSFLGEIPEAGCHDWREVAPVSMPADVSKTEGVRLTPGELTAPDGQHRVKWRGSSLTLIAAPGTAPIELKAGCGKKKECPDISGVTFSPDSKRLAFTRARAGSIQVVDSTSGAAQKPLRLSRSAVLPDQLAWGERGIVALVFTASDSGDSAEDSSSESKEDSGVDDALFSAAVSVSLWPDGQGRKKSLPLQRSYDTEVNTGELVLDPRGRYLFELRSQRRDGETFTTFDLGTGRETRLGWHHSDTNCEDDVTLQDGTWIPGKWPVWEAVEEISNDCHEKKQYRAWRVFTAPGQRGLRVVDLGERDPSAGSARFVKDDGKTIATARGKNKPVQVEGATDAERRWTGTGKGSIKRLSDGAELLIDKDGCVRTDRQVFDCPLRAFADKVFLLGSDPLTAKVILGDQVAHLFHHPGLIEDFFEGRPVAPAPAAAAPVGLPPSLEVVSVQPGEGGPLQVTLLARDGGDGVSVARAWLGGRPLGAPQPIRAGEPSPITLEVPAGKCREPLLIYACNGPGPVCSPGQKVAACGKGKK